MKKEVVNTFGKDQNKVNALISAENNVEDRSELSFLNIRNRGVLDGFDVYQMGYETCKSKYPFKTHANRSSTSGGKKMYF